MRKFQLKIITPEKIILSQEVEEVLLPTRAGQVGILAGHVPYLASLRADELLVYPEKGKNASSDPLSFAIDFGLAEFARGELLVLVASAAAAAEIDLARAREARQRAAELMAQTVTDEDYANILAVIEREEAKIKVASKYRLKHRVS